MVNDKYKLFCKIGAIAIMSVMVTQAHAGFMFSGANHAIANNRAEKVEVVKGEYLGTPREQLQQCIEKNKTSNSNLDKASVIKNIKETREMCKEGLKEAKQETRQLKNN